jgi:hypothetical protein
MFPGREGWFVYSGHDERGIAIHGVETYRIPQRVALADFPEVVRQLEAQAHLGGPHPMRSAVLDKGYRAWLAADPERKDAHALLACIRDAWFDRWRELDRLHQRVQPATLAASAVAAWAKSDGQPWTALASVMEAESRLGVLTSPWSRFSAYQANRDEERHLNQWWEHARHWHWNALGEFAYLFVLILFAAWPWLCNASPWRWGLHLGLLPALFLLPYWLGYAYWSCPQFGPSGGVLYPSLVLSCPRLADDSFDAWVLDRVPPLLYPCSYPIEPDTGWFQTDLNSRWSQRQGPGPATVLLVSVALGLTTYGGRRALLRAAGRAA